MKKKEESKYKPLPEFKITLAEPKYLKEPIANIKSLINEANIKITKDKLVITEMDNANVAMVIFELLSSSCVEWDVRKGFVLGLNLNNFYSVLQTAKKDDLIVLKRKEDYKLGIELKGKSTREFEIPILDLDLKEQKEPELKFTSTIKMLTEELNDQIEGASAVAEGVFFTSDKDKFIVHAEGDLSKFSTENKDDGDLVRVETDKKTESRYSIEYLKNITNAKKISEEVKIEYGNNYPLRLTYIEVDRLRLKWIIAPRITSE